MTFKFKKDAKLVITENEFESLFNYNEIDPDHFLNDEEDIKKIYEAMDVVVDFLNALEDEGLLVIEEE